MTTTALRPLGVDTTRDLHPGAATAKDSPQAVSTPPAVTPSGRTHPDKTWHGTSVGYRCRRCRCDLCKAEHREWHKAYRARLRDTGPLTVDPLGARRRLEALMAIGWPLYTIAAKAGRSEASIREFLNARVDKITIRTDQTIRAIYTELYMTPGPSQNHTRRHAVARGFYAPLAWDDIDDPDETPDLYHVDDDALVDGEIFDPIVVERILGGDNLPATRAERTEVVRRWMAAGRAWRALEVQTGWNVVRYLDRAPHTQEEAA